MTAPSATPGPGRTPGRVSRRLPPVTLAVAGLLLLIPLVALAIVPVYSRQTPQLWGFPFFYWYALLWTLLAPVYTYGAYLVIERAWGCLLDPSATAPGRRRLLTSIQNYSALLGTSVS